MQRSLATQAMQRVYDLLFDVRPERTGDQLSIAFFIGYEHPDLEPTQEQCGDDVSDVRAAWMAGIDSRRCDDELDKNQLNGEPLQIAF